MIQRNVVQPGEVAHNDHGQGQCTLTLHLTNTPVVFLLHALSRGGAGVQPAPGAVSFAATSTSLLMNVASAGGGGAGRWVRSEGEGIDL